jgi:hypothetical protein
LTSIRTTVDLPVAIPPVSPTFSIGTLLPQGPRSINTKAKGQIKVQGQRKKEKGGIFKLKRPLTFSLYPFSSMSLAGLLQ